MPTTLKIWPFDSKFSFEDKKDLLEYFGATKVIPSKRCGNTDAVIACFKKDTDCDFALKRLHQQNLGGGKRLIAVYEDEPQVPVTKDIPVVTDDFADEELKNVKKLIDYEKNMSGLSRKYNVNHPVPPRLKYSYPPATPTILANISHAIASNSKLYTQVLHLMNKMNLDIPFGPLINEKAIHPQVKEMGKLFQQEPLVDKRFLEAISSSSESELESEESISERRENPIAKPVKRSIKSNTHVISKRRKFELMKKTSELPNVEHNPINIADVFDVEKPPQKQELVCPSITPVENEPQEQKFEVIKGGFGVIEAAKFIKEEVEQIEEKPKFITDEELKENIISKEDRSIIPVFVKYSPGVASCKLYIKNLAKQTTEQDLKYIFGRYIFWHNEVESEKFTIKLMKEGRMKGQAFVTFPNVDQAKSALEDVNGYILHDKPMVIMFGKVQEQS